MWFVAEMPSLAIRIRRARERLNMSQQQLADAVHRSRSAVNSWETGKAEPRNSIGALEQILGVDLTEDAPDQGEQEIRELAHRLELEPEDEAAWIALYRRRKASPPGAEREVS